MRPLFLRLIVLAAAGLAPATATTQPGPAPAPPSIPTPPPACDRACLLAAMDRFLDAVVAGRFTAVPLAEAAEVRENTRTVPLARTVWVRVRTIRSRMTFADALTGNVVSRAGVELDDGRPAYLSTRLKVAGGGKLVDVELSADTSAGVVASYVFNLDPRYAAVLAPAERLDRAALDALARRYFQALTDHRPTAADFDDRCNRWHSGQQITNVARNSVEAGAARTCVTSLEGELPWGPAVEQRFPVIDVERGVVVGVTLLHYPEVPGAPRIYVSEVFKVVGGKILLIDNIGLMLRDAATLGFVH